MATYDLRQRPLHSTFNSQTPVKVVSAVFDGADAATKKGSAVATNDIFNLVNLPANALVLAVFATTPTVEGGTCTFTIQDSVGPNAYITGMNGNTSTTTTGNSLSSTTAVSYLNTAAATIDLKLITGTAAAVVVKVSIAYIEMNPMAQ